MTSLIAADCLQRYGKIPVVQGFYQRPEDSYDWISFCHKAIPESITTIRRLDAAHWLAGSHVITMDPDMVLISKNICHYLGLVLRGDRKWILAKLSFYYRTHTDGLGTFRDSNVGREFEKLLSLSKICFPIDIFDQVSW